MDVRLQAVLNLLDDAILGLDEHFTLLLFNQAAGKLFGCDPLQSSGRPAASLPAVADALKQLDLVPGDPGASPRSTRRLLLKRGDEHLPVQATVVRTELDGRPAILAMLRDTSFERQMEKAVYESRKTQALGALAAGIAHDFNNVLAAVISQIDLAMHAPEFPATLKEHLIYAQTSARRGAELVSKLQAFTQRGKSVLEPVDLPEVIEQTVFMLRRSIDPKISIQTSRPLARPWPVKADASQITQALLNLAINARDAMPPSGGVITIGVENVSFTAATAAPPRRAGEFVRLDVIDNGAGMAPEVASRVFDPYFSTKDLSRGPGLGLSISATVVGEHSGWMEVESHPGKGSRFSIFLPRLIESATLPPKRAASPVPDTKVMEGRERILVVDDEELVRMVTKAVLAYRGYQVVEAVDGEDAVAKYSADPASIQLVLMDQHMPRLNGYDALQRIRQINPQARAIMLSGGVHDPESSFGQMENITFLHKPFENQELLRVVRQLLDTP